MTFVFTCLTKPICTNLSILLPNHLINSTNPSMPSAGHGVSGGGFPGNGLPGISGITGQIGAGGISGSIIGVGSGGYPCDPRTRCLYYNGPPVCGSNMFKYSNLCELEKARCSDHNIHQVPCRKCVCVCVCVCVCWGEGEQ